MPERRDVLRPFDQEKDPLAPWKTLNAMLAENPPSAEHELPMKQFATIGIGPGLDVEEQDEVTKKNLARTATVGRQLLDQSFNSGWSTTQINGWRYPSRRIGRAGDDFLLRAVWQSLAGIVANDPEEAVYLLVQTDADGDALTGANGYEMRFAAGQEPRWTPSGRSLCTRTTTSSPTRSTATRWETGARGCREIPRAA